MKEMKEKSGEVTGGERAEITEVGEGSEGLTEKTTAAHRRTGDYNTAGEGSEELTEKTTAAHRRTGDYNAAPAVTTTWVTGMEPSSSSTEMGQSSRSIRISTEPTNQMNPWACICWLVVFLRRHRVRPTVAMACGVEAILLWLAIQEQQHVSEHSLSDLDFLKALKIISIGLTIYNAVFTLGDWIGYRHSHPHLAAFHLALLVLALTHFVIATTHLILSSRLSFSIYMETVVSGLGVVVAFIELYGADAYFAAKRAYRDTHPHLMRLQPRSQSQSIVHRAVHVVHPPSSSSSSSGIQLVQRGAPRDLEAQLYEEDDFYLAPECEDDFHTPCETCSHTPESEDRD